MTCLCLSLLFPIVVSAETLTLDQALERAKTAPDGAIAAAAEREADARRTASTSALFPRLRVEGGIQVWNKVSEVRFSNQEIDLSTVPESFRPLLAGFNQPTRTRDQITGSVSLIASQPLTGLYPLLTQRSMNGHDKAATLHNQRKVANDIALRVVEAYVGALAAQQAAEVATKNVDFAKSFLARTEQMVTAGSVGRSELLKAKTSLARAEDTELQARTSVQISRGTLASILAWVGANDATLVEPAVAALVVPSFEAALEQAKANRPELAEIDERIAMAEGAVHVAWSRMIPDINAQANYTHTEGQSFQIKDQFFVGASLGWDFWEWGNKWFLIDEAKAKTEGLQAQRAKLVETLMLELRQAHVRAQIAEQTKRVATSAKESGNASLEDERTRYLAGANTATDILLAQANSLQADFSFINANTQLLLARATLDRAIGKTPLAP